MKYKYILKKKVCNKLRKIYIKINSKSKKQYLKYKGKMINIIKYKKIKNKKNNKKSKSYSKNMKRKKHKKIGGVYHQKFGVLISKFESFIKVLESKDICDLHGILDAFLDTYTNIKNKHENEKKSLKEHFDFLTTLLIYIDQNYSNLSDKRYKSILIKIRQLLQTIEESGITGIFNYSSQPIINHPYTITDLTNFETIKQVIINFRDNYKKIIWNIFISDRELIGSNITISNTQVSTLIRYVLSKDGLSNYIKNYRSAIKDALTKNKFNQRHKPY
tara:strand:- start:319 stop:1143 length:825 start_codon:yes stop_codon:yes gene_type:complete